MSTQRHYSRAPIAEAVIDLQVTLPESTSLDLLATVQAGEEQTYPVREDRIQLELQSELSEEGPQFRSRHNVLGYVFWHADRRQSFQARFDGFTFSRLAPYDRWETFRDEAQRLWNTYKAVVTPTAITRVAVRYVNRIDLPLPLRDFKDYLRTMPEVSADLPQALSAYLLQLRIAQEDLQAMLILNQATQTLEDPDMLPVLLDIDLIRIDDIPQDENSLWELLEQLRTRKNEVFEACITERTRRLFS